MVCRDSSLFTRLHDALIKYRTDRVRLIESKRLPLLSSERPFRFNSHAHKLFLQSVSCSRRYHVIVDQEALSQMHNLGLLNPDAVIQDSGFATVDMSARTCSVLSSRPADVAMQVRGTTMWIPNYVLKIQNSKTGTKERTVYTPFVAQPSPSWWPILEMDCVSQDEDVTHNINKTTLGPYSFHVFVSAAWTELHTGGVMPRGRRPLHLAGKAHFKRPLASQLKKEVGMEQKRPKHT